MEPVRVRAHTEDTEEVEGAVEPEEGAEEGTEVAWERREVVKEEQMPTKVNRWGS